MSGSVEAGVVNPSVVSDLLLGSLRSDDGVRLRRQTWSRGSGERSPSQWRENNLKIRARRRAVEEAFLFTCYTDCYEV